MVLSCMEEVDKAMSAKDLDLAVQIRSLSKEISARSAPKVRTPKSSTKSVVPSGKPQFAPGLLHVEYPRQATQKSNNGFIDLYFFKGAVRGPILKQGDSFKYDEKTNAVFLAILKCDSQGLADSRIVILCG